MKKIVRLINDYGVVALINKILVKSYNTIYYHILNLIFLFKSNEITGKAFRGFSSNYNRLLNEDMLSFYVDNKSVKDSILFDADRLIKHEFNFLGINTTIKGEMKWNCDFKSNFVWKNKYYKLIKIVDYKNNADVKIPWELSRFHHLLTLGKAYKITQYNQYLLEFKNQINSWIEKNPYKMSVNWTCTMDVAIRAVNLITAYELFEDGMKNDEIFISKYNELLWLHGKYIIKNLENKGIKSNHYISNLVGLIWLGIYFNNEESNKWLKFSIEEIENEISFQVNEDGTSYEGSTSYHKLNTELFILSYIICKKNYVELSYKYVEKLEKMCEFIANITKPNGLAPIIGDNDDGRLLILSSYYSWNRRDFRYILSIASKIYKRNDFFDLGKSFIEDRYIIFGKDYINEKISNRDNFNESISYDLGGYYILKNKKIYCCIRCGQLSFRGQGGHSHNEQLSFELNINGKDIFIDTGTYVYSSDYRMRNLFRSTKMHNTVSIENNEQNNVKELNLFELHERTFSKCKLFKKNKFEGIHYGYYDLFNILHKRNFELKENKLRIVDSFQKDNKLNKNIFLNLDKDISIDKIDDKNLIIDKAIKVTSSEKIYIKDSYTSDSYGILNKNKKIIINTSKEKNVIEIEIMK